jgi:MYXO-CTERM domain-containing protein
LPAGQITTVTFHLDLPTSSGHNGAFSSVLITPTFSPEPTSLTLGLSGVVMVGLGAWRRRRPSRYQGQTIPPPC